MASSPCRASFWPACAHISFLGAAISSAHFSTATASHAPCCVDGRGDWLPRSWRLDPHRYPIPSTQADPVAGRSPVSQSFCSSGDDAGPQLGLSVSGPGWVDGYCVAPQQPVPSAMARLLNCSGLIVPHMVRLLGRDGLPLPLYRVGSSTGMAVVTWCVQLPGSFWRQWNCRRLITWPFLGAPFFMHLHTCGREL